MPATIRKPPPQDEASNDHERLIAIEERATRTETRESLAIVLAICALGAIIGLAVLLVGLNKDSGNASPSAPTSSAASSPTGDTSNGGGPQPGAASVTVADTEAYKRPDPSLPAVPAGPTKKFKVDVFEHVTKVSNEKPAVRVWSFGVNGVLHRGTGVSTPMVVVQGDKVEMTLVNGSSKKMNVTFPHSIDFHSSELAPNVAFKTIEPGKRHKFSFVAKHPGVYTYHCATDPVLMHTGAGMVGMMVVKPKNLAPVDRELWITQQEFYIGKPGKDADSEKMAEKNPDVIAFNGFAAQYKDKPIRVKRGEKIRMFVLNAGPSIWSAFHVIGTVFDKTVIEGTTGRHAQTVNLAPSQGGWVEFTLDREGNYPFVTHGFGDMVKGAVGVLATEKAPKGVGKRH